MADQTIIFVKSFLFGMLLGAFYDVFRIIRLFKTKKLIITFVCDILYFTLCGLLTFLFILYINSGLVRGYIVLGVFLGAIFFYNTIGTITIRVYGFLFQIIEFLLRPLFMLIFCPIRKLKSLISRILSKFNKIKWKKSEIDEDFTKKGLKPYAKLLYNIKKLARRKRNGNREGKGVLP